MLSGLLQSYADFVKSLEERFTAAPVLSVPDSVNLVWITHPGMKAKWDKNPNLCINMNRPTDEKYEIKLYYENSYFIKRIGEEKYGLINLSSVSWSGWNEYVLHDKTASLDHLINTAYYKVNNVSFANNR